MGFMIGAIIGVLVQLLFLSVMRIMTLRKTAKALREIADGYRKLYEMASARADQCEKTLDKIMASMLQSAVGIQLGDDWDYVVQFQPDKDKIKIKIGRSGGDLVDVNVDLFLKNPISAIEEAKAKVDEQGESPP